MGVKNTSDGSRNTAWDYVFNKTALAVAASTVLDCQDVFSNASCQFNFPSAPATQSLNLEGSMDGSNWTVLATSSATTLTTLTSSGTQFRLLRVNVTAFAGGASPTITAIVSAQATPFGGATSPSTVTGNQGTPNTAANAWPVKLTDSAGVNQAGVDANHNVRIRVSDQFGTDVNANGNLSALAVCPPFAAQANVLSGSATANAGTVITVPQGRTWYGTITLSASLTSAVGAQTCTPTVTVQSAGTSGPVSGTVVNATTFNTEAGATFASLGQQSTIGPLYVVAPAGNAATLQLNNGAGTAPTTMIAVANGILL